VVFCSMTTSSGRDVPRAWTSLSIPNASTSRSRARSATNVFSADARLKSLEVRGDGMRLLTLSGDALTAVTRRLFTVEATATIPTATTAFIQVSVCSHGRTAHGAPPADQSDRVRDPAGRPLAGDHRRHGRRLARSAHRPRAPMVIAAGAGQRLAQRQRLLRRPDLAAPHDRAGVGRVVGHAGAVRDRLDP
jgi:hypothetical protein